jgi:membrane-associated protein
MQLVDLFLHLDEHLQRAIIDYGVWIYAILFAIIFCETGLVITPFLPGDSLLFAAGALAARRTEDGTALLNLWLILALLSIAAVLGDAVNYSIGHWLGPRALSGKYWFLKKEYLDRTHAFFERYGAKTIVIARFVPIVRTFAPFLAGVGKMSYWQFARYNILGALLWIGACTFAGYLFGNIPWVKDNFTLVILAIVFISILPALIELVRNRRKPA